MAKPRIFISSTFYDLRQIREDLDYFVRDLGYDSIRHEIGGVPYGSREKLEQYAYREVKTADILVCIIGGRFGTVSSESIGSITQNELIAAAKYGIQVFVFVEAKVISEYETYIENRENQQVKYRHVDNIKVFEFIDQIYTMPVNNSIAKFETSHDITEYLRVQFAGLFQRFLRQERDDHQLEALDKIGNIATELQKSVTEIRCALSSEQHEIRKYLSKLTFPHPVFFKLREALNISYPAVFGNLEELDHLLMSHGYTRLKELKKYSYDTYHQWDSEKSSIVITTEFFDDKNELKAPYPMDWPHHALYENFGFWNIDEESLLERWQQACNLSGW